MTESTSIRNVGLLAHVDAGKTTTTEHMLYESGRIRSLGRVDSGTAQTDWLDIERERGISVRAASTVLSWNGCTVNLIDTPGHVDFASEVERSLRVLDGAVLIVSAAEGVQAHTETLWRALRALRMPTLIFVNKMDRIGVSADRAVSEIQKLLSPAAIPVQLALGEAESFAGAAAKWPDMIGAESSLAGKNLQRPLSSAEEELLERLADCDDVLLEKFLGGEQVNASELRSRFLSLVCQGKVFPVFFGAAGKGIGIRELMDAVTVLLPPPDGDEQAPVSGVVFKLERDKTMGRMAYVRLYDGQLQNRDHVWNATLGEEEKITQIRKVHARQHEDVGILRAGDIAAVCGLSRIRIGDVLGRPESVPPEHRLAIPLLTVQALPASEQDYSRLAAALQELADEDPLLDLQWLQEERELHVKVMGPIQIEVLSHLLKSRFGLDAAFSEPSVIYKETPASAGFGYVAYTMPKPCWAILKFRIEPGPRGSGLVYSAQVRAEDLLPAYQHEVARQVPEALRQGLLGWEVTDLAVTLVEGQHHVWHTHPLDFVIATPMGIMNGLAQTGTTLLEPYLQFRITAAEEHGGRILSDLVQMRARFDSPVVASGRFAVEGIVPVAASLDYAVQLSSLTGGRGAFVTRFDQYRECPPEMKVSRPRRGVDPLDMARFILSMRGAVGRG